jgi:hypothetical protein
MKMHYAYKIVRFYHDQKSERVLRTFVSRKHAKEHCANPESSWMTCAKPANVQRTKRLGRWTDIYTKVVS